MRILFVTRPDFSQRLGGDAVQAMHTAQALRDLGHEVDIAGTPAPDPRGYDIAHIFGVFDPPLAHAQIASCKAAGVRIALSPIWWDLTEFFARSKAVERALAMPERRVDRELAKIRERSAEGLSSKRERKAARDRKQFQRELMSRADVLLPNSLIEAHRYVCDLDLQHPNISIVPNAVDDHDAFAAGAPPQRTGILCAGRVESRKNQAMLLYALRDLDVPITLAGECYDAYYRKLCDRWNAQVRFTGALPREQVLHLMREALVHVLPAWVETPGIASLEAAKAGCAIVSGNRASEYEYFGNDAFYCDPGNPESIRTAVVSALDAARAGRGTAAQNRLRALTWTQAAKATLEGYFTALT